MEIIESLDVGVAARAARPHSDLEEAACAGQLSAPSEDKANPALLQADALHARVDAAPYGSDQTPVVKISGPGAIRICSLRMSKTIQRRNS